MHPPQNADADRAKLRAALTGNNRDREAGSTEKPPGATIHQLRDYEARHRRHSDRPAEHCEIIFMPTRGAVDADQAGG